MFSREAPKTLTRERALAAIQNEPRSCLLTRAGALDWRCERASPCQDTGFPSLVDANVPNGTLDDVKVVVDGKEIGWIQNVRYLFEENAIEIRHFGIAKAFVGAGIGSAVVFALRDILKEMGVHRVIFDENHADQADLYLGFFEGIGAHQTKPDIDPLYWVWDFAPGGADANATAPAAAAADGATCADHANR